MDSDIQFGELEQSQPETGVRPDRDRHFAVVSCGSLAEDDLPIFVDLDVMREMEAHARSNTSVELGGVLLGYQRVDEQGQPFVVVTDSLRAAQYQATRGSFKFTHDTWNQITRERAEFADDLEMVGWYHTHPGWGVFLSHMDRFICNNFFGRPLDVALVVEPCQDQRGWFQWAVGEAGQRTLKETEGFLLMAHRTRAPELNYYAALWSGCPVDPRYAHPGWNSPVPSPLSVSPSPHEDDPMDSRRWVFDFAIWSMLLAQLVLIGWIALRLVEPPAQSGAPIEPAAQARLDGLAERLEQWAANQQRDAQVQSYQELVSRLVQGDSEQARLASEWVQLKSERERLLANLDGQLARVNQLGQRLQATETAMEQQAAQNRQLQRDLERAKAEQQALAKKLENLAGSGRRGAESGQDLTATGESTLFSLNSPWGRGAAALILLALGVVGGVYWGTRRSGDRWDEGPVDDA